MRVVFCLVAVAVIGGFLAHRHSEETAPVAAAQKPAELQPSAPHENNPHNWMKNSLDRAGDVKKQVAQQRKESGDAYGR